MCTNCRDFTIFNPVSRNFLSVLTAAPSYLQFKIIHKTHQKALDHRSFNFNNFSFNCDSYCSNSDYVLLYFLGHLSIERLRFQLSKFEQLLTSNFPDLHMSFARAASCTFSKGHNFMLMESWDPSCNPLAAPSART